MQIVASHNCLGIQILTYLLLENLNMIENSEKQNVVIIGAGLVGTNLAYYLSESGNFNVTVFEKETENAARTSFGNAGLVSKRPSKILESENSIKVECVPPLVFV